MRKNIPTLFDLFLDQTYPWEALHEDHKVLVIQILARLIAQTAAHRQQRENNHE